MNAQSKLASAFSLTALMFMPLVVQAQDSSKSTDTISEFKVSPSGTSSCRLDPIKTGGQIALIEEFLEDEKAGAENMRAHARDVGFTLRDNGTLDRQKDIQTIIKIGTSSDHLTVVLGPNNKIKPSLSHVTMDDLQKMGLNETLPKLAGKARLICITRRQQRAPQPQ